MKEPELVLTFDPPVGAEPTRSRVTNASRQLHATVVDVDGREHTLAPGQTVAGTFALGSIAGG